MGRSVGCWLFILIFSQERSESDQACTLLKLLAQATTTALHESNSTAELSLCRRLLLTPVHNSRRRRFERARERERKRKRSKRRPRRPRPPVLLRSFVLSFPSLLFSSPSYETKMETETEEEKGQSIKKETLTLLRYATPC